MGIGAIWYAIFGYHYGWMDDVQDLNIMKGAFVNGCRLFDPDQFIFIQTILQYLYEKSPNFPWFGLLLYGMLFFSIFSIIKLVLSKLRLEIFGIKVFVVVTFTICFLLEPINAINFTQVALYTAGISLITTYYVLREEKSSWLQTGILLVPWFLALFIRKDVVAFATIVLGVVLYFYSSRPPLKNYFKPVITLVLVYMAFIIYQKGYAEQQESRKQISLMNSYLFTMSDAQQTNQDNLKTEEDKILYEAVLSWNLFDKYKLNEMLYKRIGFNNPVRKEVLLNFRERFRNLIDESSKYHGYLEMYNWNVKFVFVFLINLGLLFLQLKIGMLGKKKIIVAHLTFWFLLFAVGIFIKMENRLFFPIAGLFTLLNLLSIQFNLPIDQNSFSKRNAMVGFLFVAVTTAFFTVFMVHENIVTSAELKEDLMVKRAFWKELGKLKNKIIVYDLHALLLLHDSPFEEVSLPGNNENIVANHHYMTHFGCLNDYYISRLGSDSLNRIFDYLYAKRNDVYLVGTEYNVGFLERYLHVIYGQDYLFTKDSTFASIQKIERNFLFKPLQFGVYQFKESSPENFFRR